MILTNDITLTTGEAIPTQQFSFTTGSLVIPSVAIISPNNMATNILPSTSIQVQFSEPVNNVNVNTVILHANSIDGDSVPLNSIVAGDDNTFTIFPSVKLNQSTIYYITFGSGIIDNYGTALSDVSFSFTTGDITAPTVSLITPTNNATDISAGVSIQVQFSETVQHVNTSTVTLYENSLSGKNIPIGTITKGSNNVYTIIPSVTLDQLATFYVVFNSGIKDMSGNNLIPTNFHFTTGDFTAPTVSLITPSNNATGISVNPTIQMQFSELVTGVNATNVTLYESSITGKKIAIGTINLGDNNIYTFSPNSALNPMATYYVVLGNGITDTDGGNQLAPTTFSFTTGDYTAPTVSIINPSNNATNVPINPNIQIQFSKAVENVGSANNVLLYQDSIGGNLVPINAIISESNNMYVFSPSNALTPGTLYYVVLSSGITDLSGNQLAPTSFSFTVVNAPSMIYCLDSQCANPVNSFNLNAVVGGTNTQTVYVKNVGGLDAQNLHYTPALPSSNISVSGCTDTLGVNQICALWVKYSPAILESGSNILNGSFTDASSTVYATNLAVNYSSVVTGANLVFYDANCQNPLSELYLSATWRVDFFNPQASAPVCVKNTGEFMANNITFQNYGNAQAQSTNQCSQGLLPNQTCVFNAYMKGGMAKGSITYGSITINYNNGTATQQASELPAEMTIN